MPAMGRIAYCRDIEVEVGRVCHSIGLAMGLVDCNGNQDLDICNFPMSVHASCFHASSKLDIGSKSSNHVKEQKTPAVEYLGGTRECKC